MSIALAEPKTEKYLKLKKLVKEQENVINSLLSKQNRIIQEKNKVIENQYLIIQNQSRSIEQLLYELDKPNISQNFFHKLKSILTLKEPAVNM